MSKKTWEIVHDFIQKEQPVRAVEIEEKTGLRPGQVAGSLRTLRDKNLVVQSMNKAYSTRELDNYDRMKKDLEEILNLYPKATSNDREKYRKLRNDLKKIIK